MNSIMFLGDIILVWLILHVAGAIPSFDTVKVNVTVVEGHTVVLPCRISNRGTYKVNWMDQTYHVLTYGERSVTGDVRFSIQRPHPEEWNLRIYNVRKSDEGSYTCNLNTHPEVYYKTAQLRVLEAQPDITISKDVTVFAGQDAVLTCSVQNLGKYKVAWISGDNKVALTLDTHVIIDNPRISVIKDHLTNWSLGIHDVIEEDGNVYSCCVNTNPVMCENVTLKVRGEVQAPNINRDLSSADSVIPEGSPYVLMCVVTGNPLPEVTWSVAPFTEPPSNINCYTEQSEVFCRNDTSILNIRYLSRYCQGVYKCTASNGVGQDVSHTIRLNTSDSLPPSRELQVTLSPQNMTRQIGEDIIIECIATRPAKVFTTLTWSKDGDVLENTERYQIYEMVRLDTTILTVLTVKNISECDFGIYHCEANNNFGKWRKNVKVTLKASLDDDSVCTENVIPMCRNFPYSTSRKYKTNLQMGHLSPADGASFLYNGFTYYHLLNQLKQSKPCYHGKCRDRCDNIFLGCIMSFPPCTSTGDLILPCKKDCQRFLEPKKCPIKEDSSGGKADNWPTQSTCNMLQNNAHCVKLGQFLRNPTIIDTSDGFIPTVTTAMYKVVGLYNREVVIECDVHMYPIGKMYFKRNGLVLYNENVKIYAEEEDCYVMSLKIEELTRYNVGMYKCIAENSFGRSETDIKLIGIDSPLNKFDRFEPQNSVRRELVGADVVLQWTATSVKGGGHLYVERNGERMMNTANRQISRHYDVILEDPLHILRVSFTNVTAADSATYTAVLDGRGGKLTQGIQLEVGLPPKVTMEYIKIKTQRNVSEITFKCRVLYGNVENYQYYIEKDNEVIYTNPRVTVKVNRNLVDMLDILMVQIWEATRDDFGKYTCKAVNIYGSDQDSLTLK